MFLDYIIMYSRVLFCIVRIGNCTIFLEQLIIYNLRVNHNTHSINCTDAVTVPLFLHSSSGIVAWSISFSSNLSNPIFSYFQRRHQMVSVQEQFPRDLTLYTLTTSCLLQKLEKIGFERFKENELDHCCTALYCITLYYTLLYYTILYCTILHSTIYRCPALCNKYFYWVWQ